MKKHKNYKPYLFAMGVSTVVTITNKLFLKQGFLPIILLYFVLLVGMWHLIENILKRFDMQRWRWLYLLLGVNLYVLAIIFLDVRVFHVLMNFTGFKLGDLYFGLLLNAFVATIFIESSNWTRKREKAQIEALTLQSENIEAMFKGLKEQINPDFLFYSLQNLQTIARAKDPNMEAYILKLANVYRYFLQKDKNIHGLREELALLESYMFLIRYGREAAIAFDVQISDALLNRKIPVFALQYLVDSYIKHCHFSENQVLCIAIFEKDTHHICITHNCAQKITPNTE